MVTSNPPSREELLQQLKAFDESKAGVKGVVDSGITKVPPFFIRPNKDPTVIIDPNLSGGFGIPVVDLSNVSSSRDDVIEDVTLEYAEHCEKLGVTLFQLLSEALGLEPDHLLNLDCAKGHLVLNHYYPPCPDPELTMGTNPHSDVNFLAILLRDQIGGLQVLLQNKWINVTPVSGALIINIGYLLQLISNGRFISVKHRVVAKKEGPRITVAYFCVNISHESTPRVYERNKELTSEGNRPIYRGITAKEYVNVRLGEHKRGIWTRLFEVVKFY